MSLMPTRKRVELGGSERGTDELGSECIQLVVFKVICLGGNIREEVGCMILKHCKL